MSFVPYRILARSTRGRLSPSLVRPLASLLGVFVALSSTPSQSRSPRHLKEASPPRRAHRPPPRLTLPLHLRVARCAGTAVRSDAWVDRHLAATRRIFRRAGVDLQVHRDTFTPARCDLLTRAHRDALATHAPAGPGATILVVRRVRDLDVPSYDLMGVHWRYHGAKRAWRGRRYVLLTSRARPPVLAHELAHFLGLPHDPRGGNLMTPGPSDPAWKRPPRPKPFAPTLTRAQRRRLRRGVRALSPGGAPITRSP